MDLLSPPSSSPLLTREEDITPIPRSTSVFERYLIALPDYVRYAIFGELPPHALVSLAQTSTFVYLLVKVYERVAWNLPRFVYGWFPNTVGFLRVLETTSAVISGSQAINFMDRRPPNRRRDLDIFVHVSDFGRVGQFVLSQNYKYDATSSLHSTDSYANLEGRREHILNNRRKLERCKERKSIVAVLNFYARSLRQFRQVQLVVVAIDPIRFIITRFHSTAVMNIITARQAISVFPRATYINRVSYVSYLQGSEKKIAAWKAKYTQRGFKIIENFHTSSPVDFSVGRRFLGDSECWVVDTADPFIMHEIENEELCYSTFRRSFENIQFQVCHQRQVDNWNLCQMSITEVWPHRSIRKSLSCV